MNFKFIDLFAGIGGFRVALEKCGGECVFTSEIDKHAKESYKKNFGDNPKGDITEIHNKKIPKHDVLCAGFPCQSFSISGNRGGMDDDRGRLFFEIVRIAEHHKPSIMLLENVRNILSIDNGKVIENIKSELDRIGYRVYVNLLNASRYGVPQNRERVYFVCIKKGESLKFQQPKPTNKKIFLENLIEDKNLNELYIDRDDIEFDLSKERKAMRPVRIGKVNKGGQGERIYSLKGHAITLSAYGGGAGARTGLYYDGKGVRRLHINECKRLMGFKTSHIISGGMQGYQQLGNAVIVPMIKLVYENINS
jgi:DNA (cytosine-5)-methyltransferase 1